jgi:hypothetical protein
MTLPYNGAVWANWSDLDAEAIPMSTARTAWLAGATALLITGSGLAGDDTVRLLGGTGSMHGPAADTQPVCYWWKPWRYGYAPAPVVYSAPAYSAPAYLPAPEIAPPPAPATYYRPLPPAREPVAVAAAPRPTIVVGYQGRFFNGAIAIPLGSRAAALSLPPAAMPERSPPPRPTDSFRYDGGPTSPVPMPGPDVMPPTDPVPTTVPALHRVMMERSRPKVKFPAYGERPATVDPLLVKWTNGR